MKENVTKHLKTTIVGLVSGVLFLLVAFGVFDFSQDTQDAILKNIEGIITGVTAIITTFILLRAKDK